MASPQAENGHVRIASEIVKQLARLNLPSYEWRVLWAILLKTWGWRKKSDSVPISQIVKMTGMQQPHASRAKSSLIKKQLLFEQGDKVGFQKNYEIWKIKGFIIADSGNGSYTDSGMSGHTDLGIKTTTNYTDLGTSHTDLGIKSIPNQVLSKATTTTTQQQQRAEVAKSFREYWNSKSNLKPIHRMTDDRRKKFAARMKEPDFVGNWRQIIDRISTSSFCTGGGQKGWCADVDWFLGNSTNYVKVLEGKYDDSFPVAAMVPLERDVDGLTPREKFMRDKNVKD